jgi:capsular exopolysaccharide synthesis family protein
MGDSAPQQEAALRSVPSTDGDDASLIQLLRAPLKHWPWVLAMTCLGGAVSAMVARSQPYIYSTAVMVELDPHVSHPLGEKMDSIVQFGSGDYWDNQEYYNTQYRIMLSDRVLVAATRDLGLQNDWEFLGYKAPPPKAITAEAAARVLRGHISIEPLKTSRLVNIAVEDTKPERAAKIADVVARTYVEQNRQRAVGATSDAVVWLNDQIDHVQRDLEASENALHAFKQRNDLPSTSINEASNALRVQMQIFNEAAAHAQTREQELSAKNIELSKITTDNVDQLPASELLQNAYFGRLREDLTMAEKELESLRSGGKGEEHPLVIQARSNVVRARKNLVNEVHNIQGSIERELAVIRRQGSGDATLFAASRRQAVELNMKEIEYHRLDRSRENDERLYRMLIERSKEADLARMVKVNNVHIVDGPEVPLAPIRPRVHMNVLVGLLVGLGLGLAAALGRERLDSSLKTPEDVEQRLGLTVIGLLPEIDSGRKHRYTKRRLKLEPPPEAVELMGHDRPLSALAEASRSLRTNLTYMNPDNPYRRILVTSSAPNEGKTTVACNIAIAMAQASLKVCIIDCDLRRSRLHRIFGRRGDKGITNLLVGEATLDEVAKPTVVPNLYCIPAGPTPPNPADVLHSERLKKLLIELGEHFDRVVIDSPPLVSVTDSAILSTLVDGTIFVLRAYQTTRALAKRAMRALWAVDSPVIGAVLNAVDLTKHEYRYYHDYYHYAPTTAPSMPPPPADPHDEHEEPRMPS